MHRGLLRADQLGNASGAGGLEPAAAVLDKLNDLLLSVRLGHPGGVSKPALGVALRTLRLGHGFLLGCWRFAVQARLLWRSKPCLVTIVCAQLGLRYNLRGWLNA